MTILSYMSRATDRAKAFQVSAAHYVRLGIPYREARELAAQGFDQVKTIMVDSAGANLRAHRHSPQQPPRR